MITDENILTLLYFCSFISSSLFIFHHIFWLILKKDFFLDIYSRVAILRTMLREGSALCYVYMYNIHIPDINPNLIYSAHC